MSTTTRVPRLKQIYRDDVVSQLREKYGYQNPMQVPTLQKVVLNMGVGRAKESKNALDMAAQDLATISGQKPLICKARRSVSGFKLREGMPIGVKVTLRGAMMWEFVDRLISLAMPRIKDFRGLSRKSFDGRGNYSLGISEQIVFPEIDADRVSETQGMDITIVTSAVDDPQAESLLEGLGMPFRAKAGSSADDDADDV